VASPDPDHRQLAGAQRLLIASSSGGGLGYRSFGIEPHVRAEVLALAAGHPYLRLPLQLAAGLQPRLHEFTDTTELERLRHQAEAEFTEPGRWGTTLTLLQCWGTSEQ
jgi:hypothetical protein